jgi:hypothetical protein
VEPDYSFEEGQGGPEDRDKASQAQYYRRGDTVSEQRVYAGEPRVEPRHSYQKRPAPAAGGVIAHFARGVARIFALLFLAAGIGLWMVYFTVMYVFGLLGSTGMAPEDINNDLLFGVLSVLISLVLLMWSRSKEAA